jgi:DNA-binding response OmpR family regulator
MTAHKIMIVDDEPHVVRILRLALEREGFQVGTAHDGAEALALMESFEPAVLISDIQMAGMDGRELCRSARARYGEESLLILVMTSMTALEERSWARNLANTEFLEKPLSPRQLVARLNRHFAAVAHTPEAVHAQ